MPAGTTGTSQLDDIMPKFIAQTRYTLQFETPMAQLVRREKLPMHQGTIFNVPKMAGLTAYSLTEGVDMTQAQQITDSNLAITPAEVGVQTVFTDMAINQIRDNWASLASKIMGDAMGQKLDEDLVDQLDSFATALGSGSGTPLTASYLSAAYALITGNATEPGRPPINTVVHPYSYEDMAQEVSLIDTNVKPQGVSEEVFTNYFMRRVQGSNVYMDGNIDVASSAAKGATFAKDAIILVMFQDPDEERERDASLRAWEVNITSVYNWAEYQDVWGIELNVTASAPA